MCASGFANTWHYPPQYRVGLEFNCNILSCRLYWFKLQHPWLRSKIPYTTLEPPHEICLESTDSAPNKTKTEQPVSMNKRSPEYYPLINIKQNKTKNKQTGYTLCNVNTEDTMKHNIALMTSTSRVYISYLLGTIIKWCLMET